MRIDFIVCALLNKRTPPSINVDFYYYKKAFCDSVSLVNNKTKRKTILCLVASGMFS